MKIDVFNHIFPPALFAELERYLPARAFERYRAIATMHDIDARRRMLDEFGDVQQVLSLSQPPLGALYVYPAGPGVDTLVSALEANLTGVDTRAIGLADIVETQVEPEPAGAALLHALGGALRLAGGDT